MNIDRCRTIYQKFIEFDPSRCSTWIQFAEFEQNLSELERTAAIFELGVSQEVLDTPELLWKKYIDFEIEQENRGKVEELFERLLHLALHSKVFIAYAQYESEMDMDQARAILERGIEEFKLSGESAMRHQLLVALKSLEESIENNDERIEKIRKRQATTSNKVRINEETGVMEHYIDYEFPDDAVDSVQMRFLKAANKWKQLSQKQEEAPSQEKTGESETKKIKVDEKIDLENVSDFCV